jgi:ferredoxin
MQRTDQEPTDSQGQPGSADAAGDVLQVHFALSNLSRDWDEKYDSLLDFAEDLQIDISAGCRYGDCGTCSTRLLAGAVEYNHATGIDPDDGYCLPCSCRPRTSVTLNA